MTLCDRMATKMWCTFGKIQLNQPAFTCLNLSIEALEQSLKYVQS